MFQYSDDQVLLNVMALLAVSSAPKNVVPAPLAALASPFMSPVKNWKFYVIFIGRHVGVLNSW